MELSREIFPEYPLWNRLKLAYDWMPLNARRILDAGCAWGYGTRHFVGPNRIVSGVEFEMEPIRVARSRYPMIDFECAPLENLPHADQSFDYIVCADVLEHVSDPILTLNNLHRVLRGGGGHLFISTPHKGMFEFLDPYNYGHHLRRHLPDLYARFIGRGGWQKGMPLGEQHRHYSIRDLCALLDCSNFRGGYSVVKSFRSGLLMYPLELNFGILIDRMLPRRLRSPAKIPFLSLAELDYWIPYGALSFNVAILVRKD